LKSFYRSSGKRDANAGARPSNGLLLGYGNLGLEEISLGLERIAGVIADSPIADRSR